MVERLHKVWREKPAAGTAAVEVEVGVAMLACLLRDEKPILALLKKISKMASIDALLALAETHTCIRSIVQRQTDS